MATQNQVNIGVNVSDNGTAKKTVKNFDEITASANRAQKAAAGINIPAPVRAGLAPGGTSGSRKASEPSGSQQMMSEQQYGQLRGSAGATGASARDFANQAQGLGGLVRLYATLAANVFAASAAFNALKNAADTTNLVNGLNTLGAASGQALGSLSKRLVEVTDGAISMREAMTATAQASSAGMSGKNIERLALVAKNASLALGVAMPDALSRLSRGIVKLEPELLDELGLFTKIGPATEKYALEIGKGASSLTDFERRQAFANAVLEEGEKKFGALAKAAANPYDKLLANLKNVLQSGGELVNKVLTPIISLLAESPTALAGVLAGIGVILLKQALPAVGQLRAGLRNSAEEALKTAEAFKESFGDEFQTVLEKRFKIPDLQAGLAKAESDLAKLKVPTNLAGSVKALAAGEEVTAKTIKNVEEVLRKKNLTVETGMRGSKKASEAQIQQAKEEIIYINAAIEAYKKKQALEAGQEGLQTVANLAPGRFDPEVLALQKYEKLRSKVDQANAISNAAQNAGIGGVRNAWELLNKEISDKGITGFSKYSTRLQGGLAALGTRIMGIVSSFGYIGQIIAVVTGAFGLLDSLFSKNAKQAEVFNKAIASSEESVLNVSRTLQAASNIEGFGTKTIANTVALSNAFNELTSSAKEALKTERAASSAASGWDKFWNGVFAIVGKDRGSKLADSIAKQISSSIDILSREGLADEYASEIKKILNVSNLKDIDAVARAWKNLSKEQQSSVISIQENANRALGNASSALQGFKDKTDTALTAYKTFTNSFVDTSPLFKLGEAYIDIGQSLAEVAAAGPNRIAQAFEELANNSQKAALFGKDFVKAFAPIASQFLKQKEALDALNVSLDKQIEARKNLSSASRVLSTESGAAIVTPNMGRRGREDSETANENIRLTNRAIAAIRTDLVEAGTKVLVDAGKKAIDTGLALINRSIANARTTADIGISKVLSSVLTGPRKLEAENEIRQRELKLQLEDVKISETLINVQSTLVDEMKLANALQAEANALQKGDKSAVERTAKETQFARAATGQTEGIDPKILEQVATQQQQNEQRRLKSLQSKKIAITGEMQASTLSTQLQMPGATLQQQEQLAKITDRKLAAERASLDVLSSIATVADTTTILAKQSAEASALKRTQDSEIAAINADIEKTEKAKAAAKAGDVPRLSDELKVLGKLKTETEAAQKAEKDTVGLKNRQEFLAQEVRDIDKRYELIKSTNDLDNQTAVARLDAQSQLLQLQSSTNQYSQQYVIVAQSAIEKDKLLLDTNIAMQQAQDALSQKREAAELRIATLRKDGAEKNKVLIDAETNELARQETLTNNTITGLSNQFSSKSAVLDKTKQINLEQDRYNQLLDSSTQLATALGNAFGDVGSKLGSVVSSLTELAVSSEKSAKAMADLVFDRDAENDPKKRKELEQEIASQTAKNAKNELALQAKIAGQAKNLFKEKTTAYKTLNGLEKLRSTQTVALSLKEFAIKSGLLKQEQLDEMAASAKSLALKASDALKSIGIDIPAIYAKFMALLGPFGPPAAAAAIAAFIGGAFGGGSKAAMPVGFTAEQQQKVQGTGQAYDLKGNIVAREGGVLGDPTALAKAVETSIETLNQNFYGIFDTDNSKLINTLKSIQANTKETAVALMQGATGLFGGRNPFGFQEGSSTGSLGFSKSSSTIADEGIKISGTISGLAQGMGNFTQYMNTIVKSSSWWGLSSNTSFNTELKQLQETSPKAVAAIQKTFADVESALLQSADFFYGAGSEAANIIKQTQIELTASAKDLSATEFADLLMSEITVKLNAAAKVAFPELGGFQLLGEEMYQTLTRLQKDSQLVSDGFAMLNLPSKELTGSVERLSNSFFGLINAVDTVDISSIGASLGDRTTLEQQLIEASGGADKFAEGMGSIFSDFFDDTKRYTLTLAKLNKVFQESNMTLPKTKAEYLALLETTTDVTQLGTLIKYSKEYNSLISLQTTALGDTIGNFEKFADSLKQFRDSLLLGSQSILTPLQKYNEAKLQYETTAAQALAGDEDAQGRYQSAAQSFLTASSAYFASSGQYINDFNTVLGNIDLGITEAERQLDIAKQQRDLLTSIDTNIATLAGVPQLASGGRASGLTLVGERGPELVDFSYPGMVYPADQTRGMFAPQANMSSGISQVVQELRQVKQELAQLRKEQQQQTGDLIVSNYDANNRAAEAVTTEVANAATLKEWQQRNKAAVI